MNVLVLHGSSRKNGNTNILADEFIKGAKAAGHQAEKIQLKDKNIKDCLGCGACQINKGNCVQKDDMTEIYTKMLNADVIAFASPVYFYTWTSLIKRLIDRTFAIESLISNKKFYLISSGAAPEEKYMETMLTSFRQYIGCFRNDGNVEGGYVFGYSANNCGDVNSSPAIKQAYELGKNI